MLSSIPKIVASYTDVIDFLSSEFSSLFFAFFMFNPRAYKGAGGGSFQDEFLSRPAVFSSCAPIPKTHFDIRLVRIGCYGYEI